MRSGGEGEAQDEKIIPVHSVKPLSIDVDRNKKCLAMGL
jgi:hypothetical protein